MNQISQEKALELAEQQTIKLMEKEAEAEALKIMLGDLLARLAQLQNELKQSRSHAQAQSNPWWEAVMKNPHLTHEIPYGRVVIQLNANEL